MSLLGKVYNNLNIVEEAFDRFYAEDVDTEDVTIGTAMNLQEVTFLMMMMNMLMAASIPLLMCTVYVAILKVVLFLIEIRVTSKSSKNHDPEAMDDEKRKIPGCWSCWSCWSPPGCWSCWSCWSPMLVLSMLILGLVLICNSSIHFEVVHRWGRTSDKDDFLTQKILALKENVDETFDVTDMNMKQFGIRKAQALDDLIYAREDIQELIVSKIDRVFWKGEAFLVRAEQIDNIYNDYMNKVLATAFSFIYISSCMISIWFWLFIISRQMKQRLLLFFLTSTSCFLFLFCALTAFYVSIVQAYLTDYLHPGSDFIQRTIIQKLKEFINQVTDHFDVPTALGLSS